MPREAIFLECTSCGMRYYRSTKSSKKQAKMEIRKFCRMCRSHTPHKERRK